MKSLLLLLALFVASNAVAAEVAIPRHGVASWYGEAHRGKLMANGKKFNPDKLTAASWFYPLGTRLCVTVRSHPERKVIVTVTDRGPARRLVRHGRVIDLARAAFAKLASPDLGLVAVTVSPVTEGNRG